MITRLQIKNYAIIEKVDIDFSDNLTIITGETGAGKSILLGALGLIMGKRADTRVLYEAEKKCVVEAEFDIRKYKLKSFFEENDLFYDKDTTIRRELFPSGKSRAFINDTPVNLGLMKQLSGALIDLHQQFDTMDIHNVSFQLRMLDALANNSDLLDDYTELYTKYRTNVNRLNQLIAHQNDSTREMDFLKFQLDELHAAELIEGQQTELEDELNTLANAEGIKFALTKSYQQVSEDETSIISQLTELSNELSGFVDFNATLSKSYDRLINVREELQDLASEFENLNEDIEHDEARIIEVKERLDLMYKLQQKHNVQSLPELLAIQTDLENKMSMFGDNTAEITELEGKIAKQEEKLHKIANKLSEKRKAVIPDFEGKIHKMLTLLSMQHARLKIDVQTTEALTSSGTDEVNFLFAANQGSRFDLLKNVASGGELSRLTLCTKSLVASAIPLPTLIFDEIDSGVSGDVALKMGDILTRLAKKHQVVSITHSPQVAARANTHYHVKKKAKDGRTYTRVKELDKDERIFEIATMLSGSPPSESAKKNAADLVER